MTNIIFNNYGNPVTRWVEYAVPFNSFGNKNLTLGTGPAIFLRDVGKHSKMYASRIPLNGQEVELPFLEKEFDNNNIPGFIQHPAVFDDLRDLIPKVTVNEFMNSSTTVLPLLNIKQLENNKARMVFQVSFGNGEYHMTIHYTFWSIEQAVRFQTEFVWCDRNENTPFEKTIEDVTLDFSENANSREIEFVSDFELAEGIQVFQDTLEVVWTPPNGVIGYAEIYRLDGYLVNYIDEDLHGGEGELEIDLNDYALIDSISKVGPVIGSYTGWTGKFLCYRTIPALFNKATMLAHDELTKFEATLASRGNYYRTRPYSSATRPGIAGGQPSFGATKGGPVVTGDLPALIRAYCYSMADEALRPIHHREADGSLVLMRNHPQLRTWMRTVHKNAKDKLGKNKEQPRTNAGASKRYGHDENHVADYMSAYLALTGDYMAERWYTSMLQMELACINPYNGWGSMDRGTGRVSQFYSNALLLLPEFKADIEAVVAARMHILENDWAGKNVLAKDPKRPVKVLSVVKDPRWLVNPDGTAEPAFSPWQTAKGASGLYALSITLEDQNLAARARNIALLAAETVVQCFLKDADGILTVPYTIRYYTDDREGLMPELNLSNWEVNMGSSDWGLWSLSALKIVEKLSKNTELVKLAESIRSNFHPITRWIDSEWIAV